MLIYMIKEGNSTVGSEVIPFLFYSYKWRLLQIIISFRMILTSC